jgi:hypothetical protein
VLFRYDNAPHHVEVFGFPDHKHTEDTVLASPHPTIEQILQEVAVYRGQPTPGGHAEIIGARRNKLTAIWTGKAKLPNLAATKKPLIV